MQKNFTQPFKPRLASGENIRKLIIAATFLSIISVSLYLWAAIVPITPAVVLISADKAANSPLPEKGYTIIPDIVIAEGNQQDFVSGTFTLTAPTGWKFNPTSNIEIDRNLNISSAEVTSISATSIVITFTVQNPNRSGIDRLVIKGVGVQADNGADITSNNNAPLILSTNINKQIGLPTTVASLSQTVGAPRKIEFGTQPGAVGPNLAGDELKNPPVVRLLDNWNRPTGNNTVTLSITAGTGTSGATLSSTSVSAEDGIATFTGVSINLAGNNYSLTASSQLITGQPVSTVQSNTFSVINKQPIISSFNPACIAEGNNYSALIINGTDFGPGATVQISGNNQNTGILQTAFVNKTQISVSLNGTFLASPIAGTYSVQVTNPGPVVATPTSAPQTFTVYPSADAITGSTTVCANTIGETYTINTVTGAQSYNWKVVSGPASIQTPSATNSVKLNFGSTTSPAVVVLSVEEEYQCGVIGDAETITIQVNPLPLASIAGPTSINTCDGNTVNLSATPSGAAYQWFRSTDNGLTYSTIPNATAESYPAGSTGRYKVQVTVNNCSATSDDVILTVLNSSNIITNAADASLCPNNSITLTALTGVGYGYVWQSSADNGNTYSPVGFTDKFTVTTPGLYRVILTTGINGCAPITSNPVNITPEDPIVGNEITTQNTTICQGSNIALLAPPVSSGDETTQYEWQSSIDNFATYITVVGTGQNHTYVNSGGFTGKIKFRRVVTTGCTSTSAPVEITVTPTITNNQITSATQSICYNATPAQITAGTVGGGAGSNSYSYQWQQSTISATDDNSFTDVPATTGGTTVNYTPGKLTQTTWFRRVVTSGGCSSKSNAEQITVTRNTYTLILTVHPADFPVCNQTRYKAIVLKNVTDVVYPANPRFQQVTWTGGEDVTDQFVFDWWKNDTNDRINGDTDDEIRQAGLQSMDYYTVRAKPFGTLSCAEYNFDSMPELTSPLNASRNGNVLFSNRIYLGIPENYDVKITADKNPICYGTPVTFTAVPNAAYANLSIQWVVRAKNGGTVYTSPFGPSLTLSSTALPRPLMDGDVVSVNFNSSETNCGARPGSNPITMTVYDLTTITLLQDKTVCEGIPTSFSVIATGHNLGYSWFKNDVLIPNQNTNTLSFNSPALSDNGTYQLKVTGTCGEEAVSPKVTLTVKPFITNTVTIKVPDDDLEIGGSATYEAISSIAAYNPTYRWYVANLSAPDPTFKLQINDKGPTLTIDPVPQGQIQVRVEVDALSDMCVTPANQTASATTVPVTPLPVELLYLKATKQDNNVVEVEWATAMEQNSEGFEVQVSQDAKNYRTLAFVNSKAGGNTNQKQVYTFHDKENGKYGTRYYRLMQRDMNGDAEYFGPKAVKIGEATESLSVYPNPFTSEVNLELNAEEAGTMHVMVTNAIGAKVLERTLQVERGSSKQNLKFNRSLPQGMYHITTQMNGKVQHFKLLKQH
ncbi:hypothetical protein AAE02nite_22180 [Adhaeribacter aerolatus]|uniref:Ig-like domain-containing protein n=1 Tax=Adhaeribacter aerolatus TaxID=670289 RepID=A0A512AXW9_9BACT|nr:T9SS type A sorting domain-containing protein [Adhaeribacter aerolatus]GEO04554.1 hypothetical protein AAE02nite_22180 [Adhaeribacter aerolatus]